MAKAILLFCFLLFRITGSGQPATDYSLRLDAAIEQSGRAYEAALRTNNQDSIFASLTAMFTIYLESGDYDKSFEYGEQLYNIALKSNNKIWIAQTLIHLGRLYAAIGDFPGTLNYYRRAINMGEAGFTGGYLTKNRIVLEFAEAFAKTNQFDSASRYYHLAEQTQPLDTGIFQVSMGEYFFLRGDFHQALLLFESGLKRIPARSDSKDITRSLLDMARTCLALNEMKPAIQYGRTGIQYALGNGASQYALEGYRIMADVYEQAGRTDSSNFYFRKYAMLKDVVLNAQAKGKMAAYTYEQQISFMNQENRIRELNLQKQILMKNLLIAGIIILLFFAFLYSRYLTLKRRSAVKQRKLAENELQIHKLEGEKSRAELLQQKTELEMKALRAQMNPHFIFNCLNSINRFIIGNDPEKAADYLTKFARLIRMVLENSGADLVSLDEEIITLKLYMDLEALRFEKPFTYEIYCNHPETDSLMIPSLLMQPFVENAIWHGFGNNDRPSGRILINLHVAGEFLHCVISDNGIGFSKSRALKENQTGISKSFGIKFTTERLELASQQQQKTVVSIKDSLDESGEITGTSVELTIPVSFA